jgi:hypothetical protein
MAFRRAAAIGFTLLTVWHPAPGAAQAIGGSARLLAPPRAEWNFAPHPAVLCARMAVFGLVEAPRGFFAPVRRDWECPTQIALIPTAPGGPPTSVFTQIRGSDRHAPSTFRVKINELDPNTVPEARGLVLDALQSAARSYGYELTGPMIRALQTMENTTRDAGCIAVRIETERFDAHRHNIWLVFDPDCRPAE